jgi:type IV pilus assembly protein PilA
MKNTKKNKGFTLIEILVVIGIIAILAAVVLIAINPARQFKQANDSQRTANVNAILNAIGQYIADNKGTIPSEIPSNTADDIAGEEVDLCAILVPKYLSSLPVDPKVTSGPISKDKCSTKYNTEYQVKKDTDGRVTVSAPNTEIATSPISVTR